MVFSLGSLNNIIWPIVIISTIVLVAYILYNQYTKLIQMQKNQPIFLRTPKNSKKPMTFKDSKVPISKSGYGYSLSVWLFVNDWDYKLGEWKHVLHKGDEEANSVQPGIFLHPYSNKLVIRFDREDRGFKYTEHKHKAYTSVIQKLERGDEPIIGKFEDIKKLCDNDRTCQGYSGVGLGNGGPGVTPCDKDANNCLVVMPNKNDKGPIPINPDNRRAYELYSYVKTDESSSMNPAINKDIIHDKTMSNDIDNIPLGRWFHLGVVANEQSTDIYIDGMLRQSVTLESPIKQNNGNLYTTQNGGFSGAITQLRYYDSPLSQNSIYNIFKWGPSPWMWPDLVGMHDSMIDVVSNVDVNIKLDAKIGDREFNLDKDMNVDADLSI